MGWLKDTILEWLGASKDFAWRMTIGHKIEMLKAIKDKDVLKAAYLALPEPMRLLPEIKQIYDERFRELEEPEKFGVFSGLADSLVGGFQGAADKIFEPAAKMLFGESPAIWDSLVDPIEKKVLSGLDTLLEGAGITDVETRDTITKTFNDTVLPIASLAITFELGTKAAELIHPTKEMGWGRLSHVLHDVIGFEALTTAYIDPIALNLVKMPIKYAVNQLTTPFAPGMKEAMEWYGRGHIDEEEFTALRAKAGIEPQWDYRFQRMGTKPSSYFMLNAIAKEGFWDADDFKFWLSDAGYGAFQITEELLSPYEVKYKLKPPSNTQIDFLLDAYKQMNLRSTVGDIRGIRRTLMAEGWITRKAFEDDLAAYKIKPEDAKDVLDAIELHQEIKEKKELAKAYEKKYLYGRITKDELTAKLVALGMREDWVTARVEKLFTQKEGKLAVEGEEKALSDVRIINAYKWGQKEKGWCVKELDDKGWSTEDAILIAESVDIKIENDTVDEWIKAYEKRTLNGRMTIEELKGMYVKLGKTDDWAEARAAYMEERVLGKEEEAE
jgi:hypothetical protein